MIEYRCNICFTTDHHPIHHAREMMIGLRQEFTYIKYIACGCMQLIDPPITMDKFYPNDYYSYQTTASHGHFRNWIKNTKNAFALWGEGIIGKIAYAIKPNLSLRMLKRLSLNKQQSILDVGCGVGLLIYDLKELGFERVVGIDPFLDHSIHYPNGLKVEKKQLDEMSDQWDLIMFHHSLEHMPDPVNTLKKVQSLLKPGGSCLIRVPVADSAACEKYKENWVQLDAPRHYHIFTTKGMKCLAEQAGLELAAHECDSTGFSFWGSEQYALDIPLHDQRSPWKNSNNSMFSSSQLRRFEQMAQQLNREGKGDARAFFLKKPDHTSPFFN